MKINGPTKSSSISTRVLGALALSVIMLASVLVPMLVAAPAAQASSPCPYYSIHDVFADPSGNWDGDQVNNSDELYNGLNPCLVDTTAYCSGGGNPLCQYYTYVYTGYSTACQQSVNAYPTGDYDGDGIRNDAEIRQGADPCSHPCPNPTNADLALNPNGSWDNDGISNAIEVSQGTNPCSGVAYISPCPIYSYAQVNAWPSYDWDRDGYTNAAEVRQGTNPCVFNQRTYVTQTQPRTNRLPHISNTPSVVYVAPKPLVAVCPTGYPYYHPGNGLCYANPVGRNYAY